MQRLVVDVVGLCVAARREDYIDATLAAVDSGGPCTAIGHGGGFDAFGAALVNGTAAHGEDFDDTFEGGPVHAGAVVVPAVLAACEREGLSGPRAAAGIAAGVELMCRLSLVAPMGAHKAGFHPTAVFGALAAAGGVGVTLGLRPRGAGVGARDRRQHGLGHHRVPGRRHVDQADARRLGRAVRPARGADGPRGIQGPANRARRHARLLQGVRAVDRA